MEKKFVFLCSVVVLLTLNLYSQQSVPPPDKESIRVACQVTDYTMEPGQVDKAVILKDPAGEQTVLFDITEGGAIVSLKYQGIEHIWGYNGGGLLQMAFHHGTKHGDLVGDYNPTQAGDGTAMSPVTGVGCHGTDSIDVLAVILDFDHNAALFDKPILAVWDGRINDDIPLSYSSPYALETRARWVINPAGTPKYYLRLDEQYTHIADEKVGSFGYDFADYEPWEFDVRAISPENCPCDSSSTKYMAGGWYKGESRSVGLAVAMPSSNFPHGKVSGGFNSDYFWRNRNFHLGADEPLDGIATKAVVWYVMVGPWRDALEFAQHVPQDGNGGQP
jgi:hypothetical protein